MTDKSDDHLESKLETETGMYLKRSKVKLLDTSLDASLGLKLVGQLAGQLAVQLVVQLVGQLAVQLV